MLFRSKAPHHALAQVVLARLASGDAAFNARAGSFSTGVLAAFATLFEKLKLDKSVGAHWDAQDFAVRKEFGLYLLELAQAKDAEYYLRQAYRINATDEQVNTGLRQLGLVPVKEKGQKVTLMRTGSAPQAGLTQD